MGKKLKNKARSPRKFHPRSSVEPGKGKADAEEEGGKVKDACDHYSKGTDELNRVLLGIQSSLDVITACEHCRDEPQDKRGSKEKGKQHKKKVGARGAEAKSASNFTWVCLDCNRHFCGGAVSVSEPYGHSRRHAKQERHHWAVRSDDPLVSWCYSCNAAIPIELPAVVNGETNISMEEGSSGNLEQVKGMENGGGGFAVESMKGHLVRGLANLGNTCFFNSVMQNLFGIDILRDYLVRLDIPAGPLTMALKILFMETSVAADSRGVLTSKQLFGCICAKAPQFRGYQQQDSHELLRCLLDGLSMEETSMRKSESSSDENEKTTSSSGATFVDAIFGGQLSSTVSCVECGHTSIVQEPFLDLSLPVPSKKPPAKKVLTPPRRQAKPALKDGNRSRRFREKGTLKRSSVTAHQRAETSSVTTEPSELTVPKPDKEPIATSEAQCNFSWLDYLEPSMTQDTSDSVTQDFEISVVQPSDSAQVSNNDENIKCTSDMSVSTCPEEPNPSADICGDVSLTHEIPSSCVEGSGVILLPYKDVASTSEETHGVATCGANGEILDLENCAELDGSADGTTVQTTGVDGCEQTEAEFDGFGELFNEIETTSDAQTVTVVGDEIDTNLLAGNSSCESNQEEVDNTDATVSINSCLALFTKPELLTDEHAWHCERCSETSESGHMGHSKGEVQDVAMPDQPEATMCQADRFEVNSNMAPSNSELDHADSTEVKVLNNGEATIMPEDPFLHKESTDDDSNMQLNATRASPEMTVDGTTCQDGEAENSLVLSDHQAIGPDTLAKDPYNDTTSSLSGRRENGSCSLGESNGVDLSGQVFVAATSSLPDKEEKLASSCENDNFTAIKRGRKRGLRLSGKVHSVDDSEGQKVRLGSKKVMRDATKRILISSAPPILTIHLKRFSQDARGRLSKLRGHVSFQETLDLQPYMDPRCEEKGKCSYRLLGVVEHSGGMTGGHYIAYVRGERGKGKAQKCSGSTWFYASDAQVRETSLSEVLQSEAYILFYERVQG